MLKRTGRLVGVGVLIAFAWWGVQVALGDATAPTTHTVTISNMAFTPATLHIRFGDEVGFKNTDLVPHTATAKTAGGFDSGLIKSGASWTLKPDAVGSLDYVCTFHPTMTGTIVVEKP